MITPIITHLRTALITVASIVYNIFPAQGRRYYALVAFILGPVTYVTYLLGFTPVTWVVYNLYLFFMAMSVFFLESRGAYQVTILPGRHVDYFFIGSLFYTMILVLFHIDTELEVQSRSLYITLLYLVVQGVQRHFFVNYLETYDLDNYDYLALAIHNNASEFLIFLTLIWDLYYPMQWIRSPVFFWIFASKWFLYSKYRTSIPHTRRHRTPTRVHSSRYVTPLNSRMPGPPHAAIRRATIATPVRSPAGLVAHSGHSSARRKFSSLKSLRSEDDSSDSLCISDECFSEDDYYKKNYILYPTDFDRVWSTLVVTYKITVKSRLIKKIPGDSLCLSLSSFYKYALPYIKRHPTKTFSIIKSNPFPSNSYSELTFTFAGKETDLIAQGFFDSFNSLSETQSALSEISKNGVNIQCESLERLVESMSEVNSKGVHLVHDIPIFTSIYKALHLDSLPPWQITAGVSVGILALYQYKPEWRSYIKIIVVSSVVGSASIIGLNDIIINIIQLWDEHCCISGFDLDLVSQGPEEQSALQTLFHALFSGIWLNWDYTRSLSNGKDNSACFWNAIGGFSRVSSGITHIGKLFEILLKKFTSYVSGALNVRDPLAANLNIPQLEDFYKQWAFYEEYRWDPMSVDVRTAENFKVFYSNVKEAYSKVQVTPLYKPVRDEYHKLLKMMEPVMSRVGRIDYSPNGFRYEPLGILIGGSPGVGKSSMATPFLHALIGALLPADKLSSFSEFPSSEIWQFNPEQEHSTYCGQFVTSLDDFAQMKSGSPEAQSELMRLIRMVNTSPYQQNSAALEDKGRIWYKSHILYATTNRIHLNEARSDICSPAAISRRFPISYMLVPKLEYTNDTEETPHLDRRFKSSLLLTSVDYNPDFWEFIPWDFLSGARATGAILNFYELMDQCILMYNNMRSGSEKRMRFGDTCMNYGISKRSDKATPTTPYDSSLFDVDDEPPMQKLKFYLSDSRAKAVVSLTCFSLFISGVVWFTRCDVVEQTGVLSTKDARQKNPTIIKSSFKSGLVSQINISAQHGSIISNIRNRNQYFVSYPKPLIVDGVIKCDAGVKFGIITFLQGRVAVIPCHFAETWLNDVDRSDNPLCIQLNPVSAPDGGITVFVKDLDISTVEAHDGPYRDLCVVVFPSSVHMHRSIMKFVPSEAERKQFLMAKTQEALFVRERESNQVLTCIATRLDSIDYMAAGEKVSCHGVLGYPIQNNVGDCGSLLWSATPRAGKPLILGLHICGHPKSNLSYAVDLCDDVLIKFVSEHAGIGDIPDTSIAEAQIGRQFVTLDEVRTIPTPGKSQIIRSKIGSLVPPIWGRTSLLKQAMLYSRDNIDPNVIARRKYSLCHKAIDPLQLKSVVNIVKSKMFTVKSEMRHVARTMTYEEAVLGIPCSDFKAIPRSTSPGYPFIYNRKLRGKKDWFGDDQNYSLLGDKAIELEKIVCDKLDMLRVGLRPDFRFIDNLKDETVTIAKSQSGSSRLFSGAPLDYIILQRQYFGSFVEFIKENKIHNGCAYGINPYSISEWTALHAHLCSNNSQGSNAVFGDYSGYDGSLSPQLMYCVLDIINDFYSLYDDEWTAEDSLIRSTLFEDVVNSIHIAPYEGKSITYQWIGSNPSGNFLTTVLNSLCNQILLYWSISNVHAQIVKQSFSASLSTISNHLRMIVYGDDNGWTLPKSIMDNVDLPSLTSYLLDHGYKYTDEWKNPLCLSVELRSCSFLKRTFRLTREGYVAPLSLDTVLETPLWTKRGSSEQDFVKVCQGMMCELALHGEDIYNKYGPELSRACHNEYNVYIPVDFRDSFDKAIGLDYVYIKS